MKQYKSGKVKLKISSLSESSPAQDIRKKLHLSQSFFATLVGVSVRTVQDWEQSRITPKGPAKSLLRVVKQHPEVFTEIR